MFSITRFIAILLTALVVMATGSQAQESPAQNYQEIVTKKGDVVWTFAEERLGDGRRWEEIFRKNVKAGLLSEKSLTYKKGRPYVWITIGQKLLVPATEAASAVITTPSPQAAVSDPTVKKGDLSAPPVATAKARTITSPEAEVVLLDSRNQWLLAASAVLSIFALIILLMVAMIAIVCAIFFFLSRPVHPDDRSNPDPLSDERVEVSGYDRVWPERIRSHSKGHAWGLIRVPYIPRRSKTRNICMRFMLISGDVVYRAVITDSAGSDQVRYFHQDLGDEVFVPSWAERFWSFYFLKEFDVSRLPKSASYSPGKVPIELHKRVTRGPAIRPRVKSG